MGIVTVEAVSEAPSMWQRPSKIPPGSITMQGECTSPVTTPLGSISTRPFAKITPSKRPEITTRLPSICPSTFAPSPRITVCSEMILPFTLPSMRNVPLTVSVPSRVTPWSINPVHSSLDAPLFSAAGHFHAISSSPKSSDTSTLTAFRGKSTQQKNRVVERLSCTEGQCRTEKFSSYFLGCFSGLFHQAIVKPHQLGVVVKLEHQLPRPHFGSHTQNNLGSQMPLKLLECGANIGIEVNRRCGVRMFSLRAPR